MTSLILLEPFASAESGSFVNAGQNIKTLTNDLGHDVTPAPASLHSALF